MESSFTTGGITHSRIRNLARNYADRWYTVDTSSSYGRPTDTVCGLPAIIHSSMKIGLVTPFFSLAPSVMYCHPLGHWDEWNAILALKSVPYDTILGERTAFRSVQWHIRTYDAWNGETSPRPKNKISSVFSKDRSGETHDVPRVTLWYKYGAR